MVSSGVSGSMEEDFFTKSQSWKTFARTEIKMPHMRRSVSQCLSWMRLWVVAYESSKTKSSWVIPKVVAVADESFSLQSLNRHSSTGLHRGGHNQRWSLTWSWVDVGKVKVKDTMDGFFVALSISSPSCIQLFICLDVLSLCVFLIVFQRFLLLPRVKINFVTCQLDLEVLISCEKTARD